MTIRNVDQNRRYQVLQILRTSKEAPTLEAIAGRMRCTPQNVAMHINRLVGEGLLTKDGQRNLSIRVTVEGMEKQIPQEQPPVKPSKRPSKNQDIKTLPRHTTEWYTAKIDEIYQRAKATGTLGWATEVEGR